MSIYESKEPVEILKEIHVCVNNSDFDTCEIKAFCDLINKKITKVEPRIADFLERKLF
ncbi:MAG: hypothetical protein V3T09_08450 [bacterium]